MNEWVRWQSNNISMPPTINGHEDETLHVLQQMNSNFRSIVRAQLHRQNNDDLMAKLSSTSIIIFAVCSFNTRVILNKKKYEAPSIANAMLAKTRRYVSLHYGTCRTSASGSWQRRSTKRQRNVVSLDHVSPSRGNNTPPASWFVVCRWSFSLRRSTVRRATRKLRLETLDGSTTSWQIALLRSQWSGVLLSSLCINSVRFMCKMISTDESGPVTAYTFQP